VQPTKTGIRRTVMHRALPRKACGALLFAGGLVALAPAGCKNDDCAKHCQSLQECPDTGGKAASIDCEALCEQADTLTTEAHCGQQYDDYMKCAADTAGTCEGLVVLHGNDLFASSICSPAGEALASCIAPYCAEHPDECELPP
jgi:hypothetical protein